MAGIRLPIQVLTTKALKSVVLAKRAVDASVRVLDRESKIMERDMKKAVPHAFGPLRTAIGTVGPKRGEGQGIVPGALGLFGSGVFFEVGVRGTKVGSFVEFGTGPAGAASENISAVARQAMNELGYRHGAKGGFPPLEDIQKWAKRKGLPDDPDTAFLIARAIRRRGIKARPFVFPAFLARRDKIRSGVVAAVKKVLEKP